MTSALIILDGFGIGRDDPKSNAICRRQNAQYRPL